MSRLWNHNKDNLYGSIQRSDESSFAVLDQGTIKGLFIWLIIPDKKYIEMMIGFTQKEEVFSEMLAYLEGNYPGFTIDFVFNPRNEAIFGPLQEKNALFEPEQQKMVQLNGIDHAYLWPDGDTPKRIYEEGGYQLAEVRKAGRAVFERPIKGNLEEVE